MELKRKADIKRSGSQVIRDMTGHEKFIVAGESDSEKSLFERFDEARPGEIDFKNRQVCVIFSTDSEVEITRNISEILSHEPGAADLTYCNGQFPVLMSHDPDQHIGKTLRAEISEGKGKAVIEIFDDKAWDKISKGHLEHVSVRAGIVEDEWREKGPETVLHYVARWRAKEISFTPLPVDDGCGVGRSLDYKNHLENDMRFKNIFRSLMKPEGEGTGERAGAGAGSHHASENTGRNQETTRSGAFTDHNERALDMHKLCEMTQRSDLLGKYVGDPSLKYQDLMDEIERDQKQNKNRNLVDINRGIGGSDNQRFSASGDLGLTDEEASKFQIVRAIASHLGYRRGNEFEEEVMEAVRAQTGKYGNSIPVPGEVMRAGPNLAAGKTGAGKEFVQTSLQTGSFIDLLRAKTVMNRLGAQYLTGLRDNLEFAQKTEPSVARWMAENAENPEKGAMKTGAIPFTPKRLSGNEEYSRTLITQASFDVEQMVRQELSTIFALATDKAALGKVGGGAPLGVMDAIDNNETLKNTNFIDAKDRAVNLDDLINLETAVADHNVTGHTSYVCGSAMRGHLKKRKIEDGDAAKIWVNNGPDTGEVNGCLALMSNQVGGLNADVKYILFGAWENVYIGYWGAMELIVDPYSGKNSNMVEVAANMNANVLIRYPQAFSYMQAKISGQVE